MYNYRGGSRGVIGSDNPLPKPYQGSQKMMYIGKYACTHTITTS